MTAEEQALFERLEAFRFDPAGATFLFAKRLAQENGWSDEYTTRAVREYLRFAFLSVAAGHPVSPSHAVDEVWHLHLIYTRSYWQDFCQQTLGRALHHEPSAGVDGERARFDEWYANTLDSYRKYFGEPPADVWPSAATKAVRREHHQRVDLSQHWVLPRRRAWTFARLAAAAVMLAAVMLFISGCRQETIDEWNPLEFRGPQFLSFYVIAFAAACVWAVMVRSEARSSDAAAPLPHGFELDAFEVAYLNGGPKMVMNVAVGSLCYRGFAEPKGRGAVKATGSVETLDSILHPVERAALAALQSRGRVSISSLRGQMTAAVGALGGKLQQAGLMVRDDIAARAVRNSLLISLAVPAIGVMKIFVGMARGRPVGFLVILCILSVIIALVAFARRPLRTARGDAMLDALRDTTPQPFANNARIDTPEAFARRFALFGFAALAGPHERAIREALQPVGTSGDGSSSGCSSGGSCGSSCGGGGGGSSGCGGCSS